MEVILVPYYGPGITIILKRVESRTILSIPRTTFIHTKNAYGIFMPAWFQTNGIHFFALWFQLLEGNEILYICWVNLCCHTAKWLTSDKNWDMMYILWFVINYCESVIIVLIPGFSWYMKLQNMTLLLISWLNICLSEISIITSYSKIRESIL